MTQYSYAEIADRWRQYGRNHARHKSLWNASLVLAALGPEDGGLQTRDHSQRNNHGSLKNGPMCTRALYLGQAFRCLILDGINDYVAFGNNDMLQLTSGTWCCWLCQTSEANTLAYMFDGRSPTGTLSDAGDIYVAKTTRLITVRRSGGPETSGIYVNGATTNLLPLNQLSHVAVTDFQTVESSQRLLGQRRDLPADRAFPGVVAGLRIYSRQLSARERMILDEHPLAPYTVDLPTVFPVQTMGPVTTWKPWQQRQPSMIGGGLI